MIISSAVTRSRVWLSSFLVLVGLQMGVKADPGPSYSWAMWAGECGCSGGVFGLGLHGGCSLLSESTLVFWSMTEVIIIPCSALTDTGSLGHPVFCHLTFLSSWVLRFMWHFFIFVLMLSLCLFFWPPGHVSLQQVESKGLVLGGESRACE